MSDHKLYNFPPLYTIQVNEQSRRKQLEIWGDIIMRFCESHKKPMLDATSCELFQNDTIQRSLTAEDAAIVLDYLVASKRVRCVVLVLLSVVIVIAFS